MDTKKMSAGLAIFAQLLGGCYWPDLADAQTAGESSSDSSGGESGSSSHGINTLSELPIGLADPSGEATTDSGVTTGDEDTCGNGMVDGNEECDDGNNVDTDNCPSSCVLAKCGDGFVQAGVEECDDGNQVNNDGCTKVCEASACGDGFVQPANGETCDDGNQNDSDNCPSSCLLAKCGDGFVQAGVEECDDSNGDNQDDCLSTCKVNLCGDAMCDGGEECDDGKSCSDGKPCVADPQCNPLLEDKKCRRRGNDGCEVDCTFTFIDPALCGNNVLDYGEGCDDGNDMNDPICMGNCSLPSCNDGYFFPTDSDPCDDENNEWWDGCLNTCLEGPIACNPGAEAPDLPLPEH